MPYFLLHLWAPILSLSKLGKTQSPYPHIKMSSASCRSIYEITVAFLELYIFADRYSVHQFRDDILSALFGYCIASRWWPDPNVDLINNAYENLPPTAQFIRFLVIPFSYFFNPLKASPLRSKNSNYRVPHIISL
ncbi:hypothetical protein BCR34DRAFT_137245 [Clohesyomyces aquaticus]|uniref:Uncharacterized protein n=1 Tax=Clohesyomyces aquaticus TaxID=1231657 RepID=A0A1Y2A0Z0_9PLEO|nr:hypothetical protein BCR34DRAFT_137245 [Clohesyomyces aquaticus]